MKRRHYKLYRVRVSLNYISHPLLTPSPFMMNAIIGVPGNVTLEESQLEYHFVQLMEGLFHSEPALEAYSDFKDLQVYNEGVVEAVPMENIDDTPKMNFHSGLAITTDDYIVIM